MAHLGRYYAVKEAFDDSCLAKNRRSNENSKKNCFHEEQGEIGRIDSRR